MPLLVPLLVPPLVPPLVPLLLPLLLTLPVVAGCSLIDVDGLSAGGGATGAAASESTAVGAGGDAASPSSSASAGGGDGGQGGTSGDGGAGGDCSPADYATLVAASFPLVHVRFEETEGTTATAEDGSLVGTYAVGTSAPGGGGPVELGVPGPAGTGVAVLLPAQSGAFELTFDAALVYGSVFDWNEFSVEIWLDAPANFRGAILSHRMGPDGASSIQLRVADPIAGDVRPSIELSLAPAGSVSGEGARQVPTTGLTRLHIVAVVTQSSDPDAPACSFPEQVAIYLDGDASGTSSDIVCGVAAPTGAGPSPMRLPGDGAPAPSAPIVVDELALYDRALLPEEIRAHTLAGRGACPE